MKKVRVSRFNRREVLSALGAGTLALSNSRYLRAAQGIDVIVLGAGLSGLYTAMLLEEQGFRVAVLEASDHVGGRVQTRNFGGRLHELGASDIGVMYARVLDMMNRLNLERVPSSIRIRPFSYYVGGQLVRADQWESAAVNRTVGEERSIAPSSLERHFLGQFNPLKELDDWLLPENQSLDIPIGQYLQRQGVSDEAIRLFGHTYNGIGMNRTSALSLFRDATRTRFGIQAFMAMKAAGQDVAPLSQVKGGNQRLPEAMAAQLQRPVQLNKAVVAIDQTPGEIEVSCADGTAYSSRFLLSTLPLPALRRIPMRPSLDGLQGEAVQELTYHKVFHAHLLVDKPFWKKRNLAPNLWTDGPLGRVMALDTRQQKDIRNLVVWANGDGVDRFDRGSPADTERLIRGEIKKLYGTKGGFRIARMMSWQQEPFSGGAYITWRPGEVSRYAQVLARPHGRIHFAGEHTSLAFQGIEGAFESGERAAGELLQRHRAI